MEQIQGAGQKKKVKKQTAFRLDEELILKLQNAARCNNQSLNKYVETTLSRSLEKDREDRMEQLRRDLKKIKLSELEISPEIEHFLDEPLTFTEEELKQDERLAYILGK